MISRLQDLRFVNASVCLSNSGMDPVAKTNLVESLTSALENVGVLVAVEVGIFKCNLCLIVYF